MQKKHRRLITSLLAIALTAGLLTAGLTAGANSSTMDLDGDGRITVHDLQLSREADSGLRQLNDAQKAAKADYTFEEMFNKLLGREYTPQKVDGVYQISSIKDLYFLQDNSTKGYSFRLTDDIDLQGMNWEPIDQFTGTFDGGGYTISNAVITTGQKNSNTGAAVKDLENQGFFAEIMKKAVVKDLNLEYIEITATANAQFIGLLAGTNRGTVTDCYTHGKITDQRETGYVVDGGVTMIAALIGRNVVTKENNVVVDGYYTTVSDRTATEPTTEDGEKYLLANGNDPDKGEIPIAAQLAVDVADRTDIHVCLSFNAPTNSTVTQFQEISGTYGVSEAMQIKQDKVVENMYQQGTVQWTTDTDLMIINQEDAEGNVTDADHWAAKDTSGNTITYTGIPFNAYHNGLERFLYVTEDTDNDGILEINGNLANVADADWYTSKNYSGEYDAEGNLLKNEDGKLVDAEGNLITDTGINGWVRYMGNDCSSSISWAWLQISPVDAYRQSDGVTWTQTTETGVFAESCRHLFAYSDLDENWKNTSYADPDAGYGHKHGIVQIGSYNFFGTDPVTGEEEKFIVAEYATNNDMDGNGVVVAKIDGKYATTSADIWEWNADYSKSEENQIYHKLYETYGQARKGDAIHCWFTGDHADASRAFSEDTNENGILDEGEDLNGNNELDTAIPGLMWEGHMRLIAEDPVIIRNYDGYVDIESSYVITHGHGGGVSARQTQASNAKTKVTKWNYQTGKSATQSTYNGWSLYQKYFLADLDYTSGECATSNGNDSSRCYLPITSPALRTETDETALTEAIKWNTNSCTAPYSGIVHTTYALSEVTVEVYSDANGAKLVESYTACALPEGGIRSTSNNVRFTPEYLRTVHLEWLFPNMQSDLSTKLTDGETYYYRVSITPVNDQYDVSTGDWIENKSYSSQYIREFTYTAP